MPPAPFHVPPPDLDRALTAFHEAGHFIADLERGVTAYRVSIEPEGPRLGFCHAEEALGIGLVPIPRFRAIVVMLFAGHAASCQRAPRFATYSRATSTSDDDAARWYLRFLPRGAARFCRADAARLVRRRWVEVEAIARALLDRGTLDGEEAEAIADVAAGRCTPADMEQWLALRDAAAAAGSTPSGA